MSRTSTAGTTAPQRRSIRLTEVGPRDGLQNERGFVGTEDKIRFVELLSDVGFAEIEVSSFVSPARIPQLRDASEVFAAITRRPGTLYSALVPNSQGLERALAARVDKVAIFTAASETFAQRNINASIEQSLARLAPVVRDAHAASLPVRGYLSCAVACPFEGPIAPAAVAAVASRLLEMGVDELDLGDTIGAAHPEEIERLYAAISRVTPPESTTLHLHDTGGRALACAERALALGVRGFDASCAGLGGCPFAPGAPGNVATEALVARLESAGFHTGVELEALRRAATFILPRVRSASAAPEPSSTSEGRPAPPATSA